MYGNSGEAPESHINYIVYRSGLCGKVARRKKVTSHASNIVKEGAF